MKNGLILGFVLTFFIASIAIAGPADLTGTWSGEATSIVCCPAGDCSTVTTEATATIVQDGNLFYGTFEAEDYEHPCWGPIVAQQAVLTGTISVDKKISGVVGIPGDIENIQGIGLFEGKWSGKKMKAVLRDLSDGSTTICVFTKE
jgi:hypothetical protein